MLLRQTLLFLPAQILVPLSQMAAAVLWTFWLDHEPMGTYALIWSAQELIYLVLVSWWTIYCLRYAGDLVHENRAEALDQTEMGVQLGCAVLQTAAAMAAVWLVVPDELSWPMLAATISFTLTRNISTHFSTRARAQLEALPYTINLCGGSVLGLAFGLVAVTHIDASPEALLFAYAAAQALGLVVSMAFSSVTLRKPKIDPQIWRAAWIFGGPLLLSAAFSWVGNHAIRFIVEAGLGRAAVGLMTVGWWMGMRLATFVGLLMMGAAFNVAINRLRNEGPAAAIEQLARNSAMLLSILAPSVVGVWLIGGELVRHLIDESYREMTAAIFPVAMMAGAARVFREHGADPAFLLFEKPRLPAYVAAFDAAATVVLCWIGLVYGGLVGAAWGCFLGAFVSAVASGILAAMRVNYRVDPGDIARIALATAVMTAPLLLLPKDLPLWAIALAAGAGAAIYAGALATLYPALAGRLAQGVQNRIGRIIAR